MMPISYRLLTLSLATLFLAACAPKPLTPSKVKVVDVNAVNGLGLLARAEGGGADLGTLMAGYANRCLSNAFSFPVKATPLSETKGSQQDRGFILVRTADDGSVPEKLVNDGTANAPGNVLYFGAIAFNNNTETIFEQGIGTIPGVALAQRVLRRARPVSDDYSGRGCP